MRALPHMARASSDSPLLFDMLPPVPDFSEELALLKAGHGPVAGMDEAGRGPLAGPVVAAAVILDPENLPAGLDDSKRLKEAQREALFVLILEKAVAVSVSSASAEEIDATDIRKASLAAMCRAVRGLAVAPGYALADGRDVPPGLPCPGRALIKGDQRSMSIAAASIIAKVMRDRMMARAGAAFPGFGLEQHAGYGTTSHREAIERLGGVPRLHRFTFAPLKNRA